MAKVDTFKLKGQVLDARYKVESVVGEGGFGVVYRATQVNFDEPVAIKVLKIPGHLNAKDADTFVQTFRNEGKHLRTLSAEHPAFVRAHDTGVLEVDGVPAPYLVLEWLDGEPLEEQLAARREQGLHGRSLQEAMEIMEPIFGALAYAHTQRVAHRDIKPANIFIIRTKSGSSAKLLDFGMAKVMTATGTQGLHAATQGGLSGLTPSYAAPEQWDKKMSATGPWTDVYALALVLVELLTDQPALEGEDMPSLMSATLDEESRPTPLAKGAKVSAEVEAVFAKALSLMAKDRYLHAAEFWNALVEVASTQGEVDTSTSLALLDKPATEVLQPEDFPLETRSTKTSTLRKKKTAPVDALAATAAAPDVANASVVAANTHQGLNTTADPAQSQSSNSGKPGSNRTFAVLLLAAVVVAFLGWQFLSKPKVVATNTAQATASPEATDKQAPKTIRSKWWEDLPDPSDPNAKAKLANLPPKRQKWFALRQQALVLDNPEKREDAVKALRPAVDLACKELGEEDPACIETLQVLARMLAQLGKFEEAEQLLREAVRLNEKYGDPADESFDDMRQALVRVLVKQGKTDEAQKFSKPGDPPLPAPKTSAAPSASASTSPMASAVQSAQGLMSALITAASAQTRAAMPQDNRDTWTQIEDEIHEEKTGVKKTPPAPAATEP